MNRNIKNTILAGLGVTMMLLSYSSCSDTWDDHYDTNSDVLGKSSIWATMQNNGDLSDFRQILSATGCDKVLQTEQIYTVWAPMNGTFNKDSLLSVVNAGKKDDVVKRFVNNHISRFNYSVNESERMVTMLNNKRYHFSGNLMDGVGITSANNRCSNGVLHVVQEQLPFLNSIYEEIEVNPEFSMIYDFLRAYNNDSLDEDRSVSRGVDQDGNKIYVDSVTIFSNTILQALEALVYEEDSNYRALLPTNEAFQARYDEVYPLFKFNPSVDGADSLQEMNAKRYVLNDLFFNMNQNTHVQDSLVATTYNNRRPDFHVYYHPYETVNDTVGIMQTYEHKIACSNGEVYKFSEWPVSAADEVFHYIKVEAERGNSVNNATDYTNKCEVRNRTGFLGFGLSENGFADAVPTSSSVNPEIGFNIPNTLSGTYDIYAVMPSSWFKNLSDADMRPYQFRAQLFEMDSKGQMPTSATVRLADNATLSNNPENLVDTVFIDTYTFQNCYLNQEGNGVILKLVSYITSSKTRDFSREMLIDCILLIPHKDE